MPQTAAATKVRTGLYVRLEAKPGQEEAVATFLKSALPVVEREPATITWYAIRLGPNVFGIYDTFPDDQGREAHLAGQVAAALMQKAPELLASPPVSVQLELVREVVVVEGDAGPNEPGDDLLAAYVAKYDWRPPGSQAWYGVVPSTIYAADEATYPASSTTFAL